MYRLTQALVFTLACCLAFAVICLGILQGGLYFSSYFPQYQPDHSNSKYLCLLGYDARERYIGYYDRNSRYGVRNDHNPQVCRLGMAVAYISIILSLLMLCKESLKKTTNVMPTLTPLGANFPTTRLLVAIAMLLLWLASLIYSLWGWIVVNKRLKRYYGERDPSDIRAAGAFYIIFHTLSAMSWGCVAIVTRRKMTTSHPPEGVGTAGVPVQFEL